MKILHYVLVILLALLCMACEKERPQKRKSANPCPKARFDSIHGFQFASVIPRTDKDWCPEKSNYTYVPVTVDTPFLDFSTNVTLCVCPTSRRLCGVIIYSDKKSPAEEIKTLEHEIGEYRRKIATALTGKFGDKFKLNNVSAIPHKWKNCHSFSRQDSVIGNLKMYFIIDSTFIINSKWNYPKMSSYHVEIQFFDQELSKEAAVETLQALKDASKVL